MTRAALLFLSCCLISCTSAPAPKPVVATKVSIDQFYSPTPHVAKGAPAKLCYGVSSAKTVTLTPAEAQVWPAVTRCVEVTPRKTTTYTFTAIGADGISETKTTEIEVGPPPARIYDIWTSAVDQEAGQPLRICFKTENDTRITVSAGRFDAAKKCIADNPMKNTSYRITVFGKEGEPALGQVDVKVH